MNNHHSHASARAMSGAVVHFCKMLHFICVIVIWTMHILSFSIRMISCNLHCYSFLISWHIIYTLSALCSLISKSKFLSGTCLNLCIWRGELIRRNTHKKYHIMETPFIFARHWLSLWFVAFYIATAFNCKEERVYQGTRGLLWWPVKFNSYYWAVL